MLKNAMKPARQKGFTLVELLVPSVSMIAETQTTQSLV
jgi:Tfp pilus assembly protein PilW